MKIFNNLLLFFGESILFESILIGAVKKDNVLAFTIGGIIYHLLILGSLYLFNKTEIDKMFKDYQKNLWQYLKIGIGLGIISFIGMMGANYVINTWLIKAAGPTNEIIIRENIQTYQIYSIATYCLLAPMIEEIVFRLSFNVIKNKSLYLIISTTIFAFLHIISSLDSMVKLLYLIPYFILGLSFGLAYHKTQNIFTSITIHILHNTVTMTALLLLT